jgi:hypothetical protein
VQDTGEPWAVRPDETLVGGQPLEGSGRRLKHRVVREALMRADKGTQGRRDGEGEEEMRPGQLFVQVVLEPLLGFMLLALGTVAVATGMLDAMLPPTSLALREAMAIVSALTLLDGTDDLAVCGRESRIALQVLGRKSIADITQGGHGRSPCMRALRRA